MTVRFTAPTSLESVDFPIYTDADPTGTVPAFQLTAIGAQPTGSWVSGTWKGSYDSTADEATATTPTISSSGGGLTIAAATSYHLWGRFTVSTEVFVRLMDKVVVD